AGAFSPGVFTLGHASLSRSKGSLDPAWCASTIHAQEFPVWIVELLRDQRVEFLGEDAQPHVAARIFLVEPPDQDHVGDGGNVPPPIALLLNRAQHLVTLENRLDVLNAMSNDSSLCTIEHDVGAHHGCPSAGPIATQVVPDTFRNKRPGII